MPDDAPILFAYDGSDFAKSAIAQAGERLRTDRPSLVVSVLEPIEAIPFWGAPVLASLPPDLLEDAEKRATEIAREGVELAREAGFEAEPLVVEGTPIWRRLVDTAEERGASIIVVGSHGRSGVAYMAMGSVATSVAHHSKIPVMVCRLPS
jgi:nucleotide-binding universal stress UspA family protein